MKNLKLVDHYQFKFNISNLMSIVLDQNRENGDSLYLITDCQIFQHTASAKDVSVSGNPKLLFQLDKGKTIVGAEHLALNNEISLATASGEIISFNLHNKQSEEITYCDGGIEKMSWSPDQEIVIFVTKSLSLVAMTSTYDPISESQLNDLTTFGDGEFITIGWGKKETQFHGSEGKQAAKQKNEFIPPDNLDKLTHDINISWRGDCELFAISFVSSYGRMFKVYNKEGMLQFTSEKLQNLGTSIAWKPNGSWIAVPHKLQNGKYTIGLFEKNGLRHREIVLPFKIEDEEILKLEWSADSNILAILTQQNKKCFIYLYTISNYHWYLKQHIKFSCKVTDFQWDYVNGKKTIHVLLENGDYHFYNYCFTIHCTSGDSVKNQAVVAVIDGKQLFLTDFRNRIVPPPMFSYTLELANYISSCGFLKNSNKNDFDLNNLYILDSNNQINLYQVELKEKLISYSLKLENITFSIGNLTTNHWLWINVDEFIFCLLKDGRYKLCLARISEQKICDEYEIDSSGNIGGIINIGEKEFVVSYLQGEIQKFLIVENKLQTPGILFNKGEFCEDTQIIKTSEDRITVSLKENTNLHINNISIATGVTSFGFSTNYIIFTNLNYIKFYRLSDNKVCDERRIERGGKLITIVSHDSRIILQMPRGNLEAINPRILSIELIAKLLDQFLYCKAMELLRKHRINLNILVDHNPEIFLNNVDKFLDEISNPQWLNLFLLDLENVDFTKTMYASNYPQNLCIYPVNYSPHCKVNYICEKLCVNMESRPNSECYLLPIITSYVKRGDLEKSLEVIWSQKKREIEIQSSFETKKMSEQALKYLLYLVDVNNLYNVALGMYDFGLVLFVANKSQKDPKEYIQFLNELKQYDEDYQKFKIDEHLKRYEKALEHVSECNETIFQEIIEFIKRHNLYQKGLIIFEKYSERNMKISLIYADYLRSQGKLENASIMYERGGDLHQAILSAKHIMDWKRCLMLTLSYYPNNDEELEKIALSLVCALEENGKFDEAFELLIRFSNHAEQAFEYLLKGKQFLKAIFEAKYRMPKCIEKRLIPELKLYAVVLESSIELDKKIFVKYKNRLEEVRKTKNTANYQQIEDALDECDILSDTTSMKSSNYTGNSKATNKTFRSSKNRRKHERKLLSLKEGNPFEDIAIIDFLYNQAGKIFNQQQHIRDTCKALLEINCDNIARNIQNNFKSSLDFISSSLNDIWLSEIEPCGSKSAGLITDFTQFKNEQHYNSIDPIKRFKPQLSKIDWEHDILK